MEVKKSPKIDLDKRRSQGLLVGLAVSLLLLWSVFQISIPMPVLQKNKTVLSVDDDVVPITVQKSGVTPIEPKDEEQLSLPLPSTDNFVNTYAKVEAASEAPYSEEAQTVVVTSHFSVQYVQPEEPQHENNIQISEVLPEFPGGQAALLSYLRKNVNYPVAAQESGIQGRVIVQFVVNRDGSVTDAAVIRSVSPVLDREAVRVILSMPRWKPGMQSGRPVRATYALPVSFKLKYN